MTANDALDGDSGGNGLQNFPVLTRAGGTSADGTLHSAPSTSYVVELFSSPQCDPSGHGEGTSFIGATSVVTDASGNGRDSRELLSPLEGAGPRFLPIAGRCGLPATALAIAVNLTVVEPTVPGHLTLYSADLFFPPLVSTINYRAGQTRANNAIVPLGGNGEVAVAAGQAVGSVHVVVDVFGYFE
ncbi:MAG: hypothetical protein ABR576_01290 [Thermoanaerobaculia bacterium]